MKKLLILIFCLSLFTVNCFAEESTNNFEITTEVTTPVAETEKKEETTKKEEPKKSPVKETEKNKENVTEKQDNSAPRLMVTSYYLENDFISPEENKTLSIVLKNTHLKKRIKNIKLTLSSEVDEVRPLGVGTKYVSEIKAGGNYTYNVDIKAIHTATMGEHKLKLQCEYEDADGNAFSTEDTIRIAVRQPALLKYTGAALPLKVFENTIESLNVTLINTGKAPLYNCALEFKIDNISTGGITYVGEIPLGEEKSTTTNLKIGDVLGLTKGTVTITYEDAFGEKHSETLDVSTKIEKEPEQKEAQDEKNVKYPLWYVFLLIGMVLGSGIGVAVPIIIKNQKQRKIDNERL